MDSQDEKVICSICQCDGLDEDTGFICTECLEELEEKGWVSK